MLGHWRHHAGFQAFLVRELKPRLADDRTRIESYAKALEAVWLLDLDPAFPTLAPLYPSVGRPSHQAPEVLRALFVMAFVGESSITRWHQRLLAEPILAIACGFDPGRVAAQASLYYLCDKLWPGETGSVIRKATKRTHKQPASGEKLPPKHNGVVERLFEQAERGRRLEHRPERFFQTLMARLVVDRSAAQNLLGDPEKLSIAMDGAPLETGASPYGRRLCDCETRRCNCLRRLQDGAANWGWDSHHKQWYYGHTLYHVTAAESPYDLPLLVRLTQASRHDSSTGFVALVETLDLYPNLTVRKLLADSAHDNAPTYQFAYAKKIAPYIDENTRHSGHTRLPQPSGTTDAGHPICAEGEVMRNNGFNPGRRRHKWRCPRACGQCACSDSDYGRVVYTYPDGSRREPPVARDSDAWKNAYKRRTSVERSLKRTLVDRRVEAARVRRRHHWYCRATLCAMAQHVDAWIRHGGQQGHQPLDWLIAELAVA